MSQQEQALRAHQGRSHHSASVKQRVDLHSRFMRLIERAQTADAVDAWSRLAAHARTFERSSYADYLSARVQFLLDGAPVLSRAKAVGVRRLLEAILDDILQDPQRRGDAPADADTFNQWWDCVMGLVKLESQREQERLQATEVNGAGQELASWVQRLGGISRLTVLQRAQLLAELLGACGVPVDRPADESDLVASFQAEARRSGGPLRASAARAALCDVGTAGLLRMLIPRRFCVLSKVSPAPKDGQVALADYLGCWSALGRISKGDLQLTDLRLRCLDTPGGARFLQVSFRANGAPFQFEYVDEAGGFDEHFIEHLNCVAQALCLPGSFIVDRVNSDTDIDIGYLPLQAAVALQLSDALNA